MTVSGRLVSVLAAASSLPVLPPGSPGGVLPCLIVTPGDDEVGDGGLFLVHRYDVSVCVPSDDTTTQDAIPAPEFSLPAIANAEGVISLANYKGAVTYLDF